MGNALLRFIIKILDISRNVEALWRVAMGCLCLRNGKYRKANPKSLCLTPTKQTITGYLLPSSFY